MPAADQIECYRDVIARLARRYEDFAAERDEIAAWYARQEAEATAVVDRAAAAVDRAGADAGRARSLVERVDLEAHRLWLLLEDRVGAVGKPPEPAPGSQAEGDPGRLVRDVAERLERAEQDRRARGELPGWMTPLLVVLGVAGTSAGYAAAYGARWAALRVGGDIDAFAPVLRLILTAFAPALGLVPAKLAADQARGRLDGGHIAAVVVAGLLTLGVLLLAFR